MKNLEGYLEDLMERLDSNEPMPGMTVVRSSKDQMSWHAHREAEELSELRLVHVIRERLTRTKKVREFQKLAIILGALVCNTHAGEASDAYRELMEKAPRSDNAWHYLMEHAKRGRIEAARSYAYDMLRTPIKGGLALTAAIEYLGVMGGVDEVHILGELLDEDCHQMCSPMYAVLSLGELEYPEALPYLDRSKNRHATSRKQQSVDTYVTAGLVIDRIKTAPPREIEGHSLHAWVVPSTESKRIALGTSSDQYFVHVCNSDWKLQEVYEVGSHNAARKMAAEIADQTQLCWHMRPLVK